ncbi:MAG: chemotaxis protein CheW [Spirochaetes bacterium]|jgi:purine-binding chemotaxis protein CheW|nr:chemotaxis protein CheW [Spirochaetota bacterium]
MSTETTVNQYLTFVLDGEYYALPVGTVREVLELQDVTKIPQMADYMKGVINVRGSVLPVIDLRLKFGMAEAESTVDTAIIVTDVSAGDGQVTVGCQADSVDEVLDIPPENIEPAPRVGTKIKADFIKGIGKNNERFIMILDIDRVFHEEELEALEAGSQLAQA